MIHPPILPETRLCSEHWGRCGGGSGGAPALMGLNGVMRCKHMSKRLPQRDKCYEGPKARH